MPSYLMPIIIALLEEKGEVPSGTVREFGKICEFLLIVFVIAGAIGVVIGLLLKGD